MSAFVVSKHDIDILVTAYLALHCPSARIDATKIGRELWRENVASVAYRYDMPKRHCEEHAGYMRDLRAYAYQPIHAKAAAVAKIARCYDYQSCEHPAYEASRAKKIADLLMTAFPESLPGYVDAPWGISDEADLAKARRLKPRFAGHRPKKPRPARGFSFRMKYPILATPGKERTWPNSLKTSRWNFWRATSSTFARKPASK